MCYVKRIACYGDTQGVLSPIEVIVAQLGVSVNLTMHVSKVAQQRVTTYLPGDEKRRKSSFCFMNIYTVK